MKRKQFSEEQIIGILKEAEAGAVVTELCRKHGMSSATYYAWKAKFGGLEVSDAKRLRALEEENVPLKRLLADTMLDNAGLKALLSKMVAPAAKRQAVAHLQVTLGMSERRACAVVGADRTSMRYRSCRADDDDLRLRLCELAQQRRRFCYRRLHILLRRDGITINRKKTQRLYRKESLTVRRRKARRRRAGACAGAGTSQPALDPEPFDKLRRAFPRPAVHSPHQPILLPVSVFNDDLRRSAEHVLALLSTYILASETNEVVQKRD